MTNPFDDPDGTYRVLRNHEGQYSLWPDTIALPDGWDTVHGPAGRAECLDHIDREWTDMRPASLVAAMNDGSTGDLGVDHVRFYVGDLDARVTELVDSYGFDVYATAGGADQADRSVALERNEVRLILTAVRSEDHPGARFLKRHGDGVADVALRSADAAADFAAAVGRGAQPVTPPEERDGIVTATIAGFGDVVHTFVQRADGVPGRDLPGFQPAPRRGSTTPPPLTVVDHIAVCLEAGQLAPTVAFYEHVLDFRTVFVERIAVGDQAMESTVVQDRSGSVTLTLIEPDTSRAPGQIDRFIKDHGGPGVQHVAFATTDIVGTVRAMRANGVRFLSTPDSYYRALAGRMSPANHTVDELRALDILADADHDGQLFQIFTRSTHEYGTFFFELIERVGATTFGAGNIRALYEAVESGDST